MTWEPTSGGFSETTVTVFWNGKNVSQNSYSTFDTKSSCFQMPTAKMIWKLCRGSSKPCNQQTSPSTITNPGVKSQNLNKIPIDNCFWSYRAVHLILFQPMSINSSNMSGHLEGVVFRFPPTKFKLPFWILFLVNFVINRDKSPHNKIPARNPSRFQPSRGTVAPVVLKLTSELGTSIWQLQKPHLKKQLYKETTGISGGQQTLVPSAGSMWVEKHIYQSHFSQKESAWPNYIVYICLVTYIFYWLTFNLKKNTRLFAVLLGIEKKTIC